MKNFLERIEPSYPDVALLLEPPRALGLRVAREGVQLTAAAWFDEPQEWGSGGPAEGSLQKLADRALATLGMPRRISILLDDAYFKAQVLSLADFPSREEERQQILRWHIRKMLDYNLEDLRLRYKVLDRRAGHATVWLTLAPESLLSAIEGAFGEKGCHVGFVSPESTELYNWGLVHGLVEEQGVTLFVNRTPKTLSFLYADASGIQFQRAKALGKGLSDAQEEEEQLLQEVRLTLAFQRDRLGGAPLTSVWVRTSESGLSLPVESEVEPGIPVRRLVSAEPGPKGCGSREELALPLFRVLKG